MRRAGYIAVVAGFVILLAGSAFSALVSFQRAQGITNDWLRAWYYTYPFLPMAIILSVLVLLWRVRRETAADRGP